VEKQGPAIAADPQAIATIQVTPRNAESPLTIAVNCAVVPDGTFALAGEITTETGNGLRIGRTSPMSKSMHSNCGTELFISHPGANFLFRDPWLD